MKKLILLLIMWLFSFQMNAQNYGLPANPEPGKCYERSIDYEKEIKWKEVDCEEVKKMLQTKERLAEIEEKTQELKKYQEKLKSLGYDVEVNGKLDNKTIIAHHKYLRKKRKAERRKKRAARKKKAKRKNN